MATLKEAIGIARKEPTSERSQKLRAAIIAGKMDDIAAKEGINLSKFKQVETEKLNQTHPDIAKSLGNAAQTINKEGVLGAVANVAHAAAPVAFKGLQAMQEANPTTPEEAAQTKDLEQTRDQFTTRLADINNSGGNVDTQGKGVSGLTGEQMKGAMEGMDNSRQSPLDQNALTNIPGKFVGGMKTALATGLSGVAEGVKQAGEAGNKLAEGDYVGAAKGTIGALSEGVSSGAGAAFAPVSAAISTLPKPAQEGIGAVMGAPFAAQGNTIKAIAKQFGVSEQDAQDWVINPVQATETALMAAFPMETAKLSEDVLKKTGEISGKILKTGKEGVKTISRSTASAASGLNAETISTAIKNPDLLGKAQKMGVDASRQKTLEMVKTPVDKAISDLKSTGTKYNPIREADSTVAVPPNWMKSKLEKAGISVEKGKLVSTSGSKIRSKADLGKLQEVYDMYGKKTSMTNNEFLNLRSDLSGKKLANFASGTTNDLTSFAKGLRKDLNTEIRPRIQGLKELDAQASGQIKALKEIKGLIYDKNGLKDNAIQTVNNLLNDAKQGKLNKVVENLKGFDLEGFAQQVKVTKALSDIELAKGVKVGTYGRDILRGGAVLSGNIPVIAGAVLSHPSVLVPLLKAYGKVLGMGTEFAGKVGTKILQGIKPTDIEAAFVTHALKSVDAAQLEKVAQISSKVQELKPVELQKAEPMRFDGK